jgi:hypothetical protein
MAKIEQCSCANCGAGDGGNLYLYHGLLGYEAVKCRYCGHEHTNAGPVIENWNHREDIRFKAYAERLGYTVDVKRDKSFMVDGILSKYISEGKSHFSSTGDSWSFMKGIKTIWSCANGWACADIIEHHFRNHRYYQYLRTALDCELAVDNGLVPYQDEKFIYFTTGEPVEVNTDDLQLVHTQPPHHDSGEIQMFLSSDKTPYIRVRDNLVYQVAEIAKRRAFFYGTN